MISEATHIDNGFYRLTDNQAGKLARESPSARFGGKLPEFGWEKRVCIDGVNWWLTRTPHRYRLDSPKRGWCWAVYHPHNV